MFKKLIFIFLVSLPFTLQAQSITDGLVQGMGTDPIPPDHKVLQEVTWKGYHIQLMVAPAKPYLRGPADFIIIAKKEIMMNPFPGKMTLSFENLTNPGSAFQETQITAEDFEENGLAKISHTFTEPGNYAVIVSLTDLNEDLFVVKGNVEIRSDNFLLEYQKHMTYIMFGIFFLFILFTVAKKIKKRPKD